MEYLGLEHLHDVESITGKSDGNAPLVCQQSHPALTPQQPMSVSVPTSSSLVPTTTTTTTPRPSSSFLKSINEHAVLARYAFTTFDHAKVWSNLSAIVFTTAFQTGASESARLEAVASLAQNCLAEIHEDIGGSTAVAAAAATGAENGAKHLSSLFDVTSAATFDDCSGGSCGVRNNIGVTAATKSGVTSGSVLEQVETHLVKILGLVREAVQVSATTADLSETNNTPSDIKEAEEKEGEEEKKRKKEGAECSEDELSESNVDKNVETTLTPVHGTENQPNTVEKLGCENEFSSPKSNSKVPDFDKDWITVESGDTSDSDASESDTEWDLL
ncbi:hypothetical protein HK100_010484 [Physocladia obscura]|uniref:Uncharacterized protein n=1 Tax=Physocladia obscura TaxID=109957 RepID=A0AAD5T9P4_9FUNG|nr:hypothetical protein HK100_010484 [Physocladia obscura]